jgi:hypothetical protein
MDCPVCGYPCLLVIQGMDQYGKIREWTCPNCTWVESDGFQNTLEPTP